MPERIHPQPSTHDYGIAGVISYGVSQGDWFVWGGFNGPQNRSAFGANRSRRLAEFTDGLSQTMLAAEVKTYQPAYNCDGVGLANIRDPNNVPPPTADPYAVAPEYSSGSLPVLRPVPHRVVRRQRSRRGPDDRLAPEQGQPSAG